MVDCGQGYYKVIVKLLMLPKVVHIDVFQQSRQEGLEDCFNEDCRASCRACVNNDRIKVSWRELQEEQHTGIFFKEWNELCQSECRQDLKDEEFWKNICHRYINPWHFPEKGIYILI
jgi:hypothetical protein